MSNFFWKAIYNDGTELPQYDGDKVKKYTDIDRDKLIAFELLKSGDDIPIVKINLEQDQRLIYRRRCRINISSSGRTDEAVYIIGWQRTIDGQNVQSILYVDEDCKIEMIGKWSEDNVLYCAPILIDEEK